MTCIKTGCHVFLVPYQEFAYGDAHMYTPWHNALDYNKVFRNLDKDMRGLIHNTLVLRIVARSRNPINGLTIVHFRVDGWDDWFGRDREDMSYCPSVMISNRWENLGYNGVPFNDAQARGSDDQQTSE